MSFLYTQIGARNPFYSLSGFLSRMVGFFVVVPLLVLPIAPVFASEDTPSESTPEAQTETVQETEPQVPEEVRSEEEEDVVHESVTHEEDIPAEDEGSHESEAAPQEEENLDVSVEEETDTTLPEHEGMDDTLPEEEAQEEGSVETDAEGEDTSTTTDSEHSDGGEIETGHETASEQVSSTDPVESAHTHASTSATSSLPLEDTDSEAEDTSESETTTEHDATDVHASTTQATTTTDTEEETDLHTEQDGEASEEQTHEESLEETDDMSETSTSTPLTHGTTTEEASETQTATTTSYDVEAPAVPTVVYNSDNRYQFSEAECISMGDGSFYCSESEAPEEASQQEDGIIAAPDQDGDHEIFIIKDGIQTQITHNLVEDLAPYYDPQSERLVWHRLSNDRYQIVSYALLTGEEEVLTKTSYNNMEPSAYGDTTVWQSWIGNGWEIVMHDGGSTTQMTDNDLHDVAPYINQDYIVWQTQVDDTWYMNLYDRDTKLIERIHNEDGAMVENPRFVLVYDAHLENGDVQTLGYDLETKQVTPLSSTPAPLPERIPEPDQTGEERALIQNKPPTEEDIIEDTDTPDTDSYEPPATTTAPTNVETTTSSSTVVIPPLPDTTPEADVVPSEEHILVVEPLHEMQSASTTATSTEHIDDIVIPHVTPQEEA